MIDTHSNGLSERCLTYNGTELARVCILDTASLTIQSKNKSAQVVNPSNRLVNSDILNSFYREWPLIY